MRRIMLNQAQALRGYLRNRQEIIDSEKLQQEPETNKLFNEKTFYRAFVNDILEAKKEVIIYSPFVTKFRAEFFKQTIERLRKRNIEIFIFTRPIEEYDSLMQPQIQRALERYEDLGVCVFSLKGSIHEKVAIIDREILWEGSLNILSQRASREIMRRISGENTAMQVMSYLGLNKMLAEGYKLRYEKLCKNLIVNSGQNFKQKIRIFLLGLILPIIVWWLLINFKDIILLLREVNLITRIFFNY
jgi:phosphatidylserine/phosphatidylglycerophosphate/cardiolipin synthase-like enzyme